MPCPPPLFFASHRRAAPRVVPRAAWCFLAAALCLVASGIPPAQGLHEDQLGRFDWYRPFLGSYTSALFSKTRSRLAVATARNALGVLNLRTGEVEWRQVFGGADPLRQVLAPTFAELSRRAALCPPDAPLLPQVALTEKPPALFTLSGRGRGQLLRAWNQHTGALVWDMPLCSDSDGEAVHGGMNLVQMGPEQTDSLTRALIFVAACGQLKASAITQLRCRNGELDAHGMLRSALCPGRQHKHRRRGLDPPL